MRMDGFDSRADLEIGAKQCPVVTDLEEYHGT